MSTSANPYDIGLDKNAANYVPLTPIGFLVRTASVYPNRLAVVHGERRYSWREALERCRRLASALTAPRSRAGRHRRGDGAEHSRSIRGAFRGADGRRGAERAQHPPRSGYHRLHPAARRGQGSDHRHRIRAGGRAGAGAARPKARGDRYRRCDGTRRRAARRDGLRGVSGDGRPGFPGSHARGRVGRDRAQLHLGHHRQSEGRRLSPSRRLSERARQHSCLGHAAASGLSVDPADVPLQRLVLPVDDHGDGRHPCLPAPGRGCGHLRSNRARGCNPSVRRSGNHELAAQCSPGAGPG